MKTNITKAFTALAFAAVLMSCSKKNNNEETKNPGNYILAVTPVASTAVADYLLTASSLETGSITTVGNGVEQDGTYRYYVTANNKFSVCYMDKEIQVLLRLIISKMEN